MNAQSDTFAGFLDVLAADLDDHEARAEDRRLGCTCPGITSVG